MVMNKVFSKILTLLIWFGYPKINSQYRWFLRFRYLGRLRQIRYFWKDYINRKPYKEISFHGEFQQELIHVLPFAYWHYKNGTLGKTLSTKFSKELYFFSENHIEQDIPREYMDNYNLEIPNAPHDLKLDKSKWAQVPLKQYYKNEIFVYDKPLLVIANRFNTEWENEPISYFDLTMLDVILKRLVDKYQVIYNRPPATRIANDESEIHDLGDESFLNEKYPEVIQMEKLMKLHEGKEVENYNHLQLLVYANCENFISIHGGTATLASYFGGTNVIYSKKGHEHYLGEFERIFPQLSDSKIIHCKDEESLVSAVNSEYDR